MKHIDPSFYPAPFKAADGLDLDDRTVVLVTIARRCDADVISRIQSALPGSEIINLSQLVADCNGQRDAATLHPTSTLSSLTHRQQEIMDYLLDGLSNKEIGRKLGLSHFTVRNHVSNILRTLGYPCRRAMRRSLTAQHIAPTYPSTLAA